MRPARGGSVPAFRGFLAGIGVGLLLWRGHWALVYNSTKFRNFPDFF